jgi:hypothetical protein
LRAFTGAQLSGAARPTDYFSFKMEMELDTSPLHKNIRTDLFIPDCPLDQKLVIPAQAGIQLIKKFPRSGAASRFCPRTRKG